MKSKNTARDSVKSTMATKMYVMGLSNRHEESIALGLKILSHFGEPVQPHPSAIRLKVDAVRILRRLRHLTDEHILRLPQLIDQSKLISLRIMLVLNSHAFMARPLLSAAMVLRATRMALDHGQCAVTGGVFAAFGSLCCFRMMGDSHAALRFGKLGLALLERCGTIEYIPRVYSVYYGIISPYLRPLQECLTPLHHAYRIGQLTGDIEMAALCAKLYWTMSLAAGNALEQVYENCRSVRDFMSAQKALVAVSFVEPVMQLCRTLMGHHSDPSTKQDEIYDFEVGLEEALAKNQRRHYLHISLCRSILSYVLGDLATASKHSTYDVQSATSPLFDYLWGLYIGGLTCMALAFTGQNVRQRRVIIDSPSGTKTHAPVQNPRAKNHNRTCSSQ